MILGCCRYYENLNNLILGDVYSGKRRAIMTQRKRPTGLPDILYQPRRDGLGRRNQAFQRGWLCANIVVVTKALFSSAAVSWKPIREEIIMSRCSRWLTAPVITMLALSGCQPAAPTGPTIAVMPGPQKTLSQFQNDDYACRAFAQNQSYRPAPTGLHSPAGTAAAATVGGTAAGALFGAAGGNAGKGAAIGAGVGLLGGAVLGAHKSNQQAQSMQQSYNIAYAQCMQTKGNPLSPS
jgi:Glycine zipper